MAKYSIFGGGPGGLYTAWRLISGGTLKESDTVEIYEWGNYDYEGNGDGDRTPAGRICSYHHNKNPDQSYIEVGGMRFIEWNSKKASGHQLVSLTINKLTLKDEKLSDKIIEFNTTDNPLFYLRGQHFYSQDLGTEINGQEVLAPYNTPGNNAKPADSATGIISNISKLITAGNKAGTRLQQCEFYQSGKLNTHFDGGSYVYKGCDNIGNIGYWNIFYDQAGNEGFQYAADAGGYSSNVINWNASNAAVYNGEFAPGGAFKTLSTGYSSVFVALYQECKKAAKENNINFTLTRKMRLHSIWNDEGKTQSTRFKLSTGSDPEKAISTEYATDYAFLAMSPNALELVSSATRYQILAPGLTDFLNDNNVQNYIQSVIEQPSYKVAMFFNKKWWDDDNIQYKPKLTNTDHGNKNVFGPTITDLPLRQIYYFGDNSAAGKISEADKVYGMLVSYDDMRFTKFWEELELATGDRRTTPLSQNYQPMHGAEQAPFEMMRMLKLQLAKVHYGDPNAAGLIPDPVETVFMNWGLNPFGAGYHAWAAHYDICDVMQKIRTPGRMAGFENSNVFIIGSAYSNDQAWVEGAFCTAESVLTEYLNIPTIAENTKEYPFICSCNKNVD